MTLKFAPPWALLALSVVVLANLIPRLATSGAGLALCLILFALSLPLFLETSLFSGAAKKSKKLTPYLGAAAVALFFWQCTIIIKDLDVKPGLSDIATTTIKAADLIAAGKNPYTTPVDVQTAAVRAGTNLSGFKYNPFTAMAYLPLVHVFREQGVLLTNVLLHLLTLLLIFALARREGGVNVGFCSALFYLLIRFIPTELRFGSTDLVAVDAMLAAAYFRQTRPLIAGLCMGLSISSKILPAAPVYFLFLPEKKMRSRFLLGSALGLAPLFFYLAWSPRDVLSNTVLFNFLRETRVTSIFHGTPAWLRQLGSVSFLAGAGFVSILATRRRFSNEQRYALVVLVLIACLVTAPLNNPNYQLWWLPLFCVLAGKAPFQRRAR